jgi:hypothetical protein
MSVDTIDDSASDVNGSVSDRNSTDYDKKLD